MPTWIWETVGTSTVQTFRAPPSGWISSSDWVVREPHDPPPRGDPNSRIEVKLRGHPQPFIFDFGAIINWGENDNLTVTHFRRL